MKSQENQKPEFTFEGAPHRPLEVVYWSDHLQGRVASTGPSPFVKVAEGLKTFGGRGYSSPLKEHMESVYERYNEVNPFRPVRKHGGHKTARQTAAEVAQEIATLAKLVEL